MNARTSFSPEFRFIPRRASLRIRLLFWGLVALGVAAFVQGLAADQGSRTWQIYFVNFLFWTGIAQGGVAMAAVYRITNARWGDVFRRIGEGMVAFLPISFLFFVGMIAGGSGLFPWLREPVPGKELWLSGPFLFGRDALAFLVLMWISGRYVYYSVRPDLGLMKEQNAAAVTSWIGRAIPGWKGWEEEHRTGEDRLRRMTPLLLMAFAVLYTLLGFDLVMALDPGWASTLFGWLFFLHAFFAALVVTTILAVSAKKWFQWGDAIAVHQWHDMGRFVFGFCLLSGGFFWSQFLVIWYGNLPEETSYLLKRFYLQPWEPLMWAYIILAYLFPLAVFLSKRVKQIPGALLAISAIILCALFLERFIAVVPFVWPEATIPFGFTEIGVTAGFTGVFVLCWLSFASAVPLFPASAGTKSTH